MIKAIVQKILLKLGPENRKAFYFFIQRTWPPRELEQLNRYTTAGVLSRLQRAGFSPKTVIDIGAYEGLWSNEAAAIFPGAFFHLFEPQPAKKQLIDRNMAGRKYILHAMLLGNETRAEVPFYVMESGSSAREELSSNPREKVLLSMTTLGRALEGTGPEGPILLKLDVQGLEDEVLAGAGGLLDQCEVVVIELSFLDFNKDGPLAHELIAMMDRSGFVIFDFGGFLRNANDQSLIQADVIFVKRNGSLRLHFNDFTKPFTVFASH